jgi:hypothetical protein
VLVVVTGEHLLDKLIEELIVTEHHVTAVIPNESMLVPVTGSQTSDMVLSFEDLPVVVGVLTQSVGGAEAGGPCPQDHNS